MVEYESRQSWVTIGVILIVILPLIVAILAVYTRYVRHRRGEGSASSWKFDAGSFRRSLRMRDPKSASSLMKKTPPQNDYDADSGFGAGQYRRGVGVDSSPSDLGVAAAPPLLGKSATPSPPDPAPGRDKVARQALPLTYDGVYHTHEPLPGKPMIEFEDKVWDLDESVLSSPPSSPNNPSDKSSAGNRSIQTDIF